MRKMRDTEKVIDRFTCEYGFLSNFSPDSVKYEGILYPTSEHAFQAAKTLDIGERRKIAGLKTPGKAKSAGRKLKLRKDWNSVRISVMCDILRIKFSTDPLKTKLLETGDATLIEGNTWGDMFWGKVDGEGENWLGKLLMKVRAELKK